MTGKAPGRVRVVIIGGGIVGCSLAYHLTRLGWTDVAVLERKKLTCGTTWHAAGLIGQLRGTRNMTRLAQYTAELYAALEAETGQATGFKQNGSITIATNRERLEELKRGASMARTFGLDIRVIGSEEIRERWPLLNVDDVAGGIFLPRDGQTNPVDTTTALAKGAKARGAVVLEDTRVLQVLARDGRVSGVVTARGEIEAEFVVNCAGMWARGLADLNGVSVPLHACEHFYVLTEEMAAVPPDLPVLRDPDGHVYFKEDAGKLLIGAFEPRAKPWGMDGIPEDFAFDELPEDLDHFAPVLDGAMGRVPELRATGIRKFFNGPESFTPDNRYLLGEVPELGNYYVAAGFNSIGIQSAGGAGKVLAEWIVRGRPPMDLWDVDIRRTFPFQNNARYLRERATEALGLLYAMHWPHRQPETARNLRTSPLYDRLARAGACFGEVAGWERANWFAPAGVAPRYAYSYGRQNWFAYSAEEHRAVRSAVGLFDQSSFAKFLVRGPDAEPVLQRICANDVAVPVGRIVYTPWLNERGGIEADLTLTRLGEEAYLVVTGAAVARRDLGWLLRHVPETARVAVVDVSSSYAVLGIMGPRSRELLGALSGANLSNDAFPFATAQEIELGLASVWALRITYVGELGWELYVPVEHAPWVYDAIVAEGERLGLRLAGMHALDSLRMEKAYRHWGHDITDEDTPLEAGLGFACRMDKDVPFIGRESLIRQADKGVRKRLVQFALDDPAPLLYHDEPIYRDGRLVGRLTSGSYGHTLGRALGLGYVHNEDGATEAFVLSGSYEIEIACERFPARAGLTPLHDPAGQSIRC